MNIVVYKSEEEKQKGQLELLGRRALHIHSILKLQLGDSVKLGEYNKGLKRGRILEVSKNRALVEILHASSLDRTCVTDFSKQLDIELIVAMPRPQTLKKVIELSACLSIAKLRLIDTNKVEKSYFSSKTLSAEEIEKHIILGLEQGRKVMAPKVQVDKTFLNKELQSNEFQDSGFEKIILDQQGLLRLIETKVSSRFLESQKIILAVGPESGWTKQEVDLFEEKGFSVCSLGNTPLRVENAVCAALSTIEQILCLNRSSTNG